MRSILTFLLTILLFSQWAHGAEPLKAREGQQASQALVQLSDWLAQLQKGLWEEASIDTIYIGGGSARAILDHLYDGAPLLMRDLDVFAIAGKKVSPELLSLIGNQLEAQDFGYFSRKDLRSRPRVPATRPVLTRNDYVAGYGLHWVRKNGEILDLSVYHSKDDLDLNGIFDIDTTMIPIRRKRSLIDFAKAATVKPYEQLTRRGDLVDRHAGYLRWREKEATIVNWLDIESDPLLKALRVVRTLFKTKHPCLADDEERSLRHLIRGADVKNPLQMTRGLLKVLGDEAAAEELSFLASLGLFEKWLPQFASLDCTHLDLSSASELDYGRGDRLALAKLYLLMKQLPTQELRLAAIHTTMHAFDLPTCTAWLHEELTGKLVFPHDQPLSPKRLRKIAISTVLSPSERRDLLLSELRGDWKPRRGLLTGVFNPVHRGHVALFREAIEEMALDELIVIPHEGEPIYEAPVQWQARFEMLKLVEKDIEELRILPQKDLPISASEVSTLMANVIRGNTGYWVRVLGSDAFESYVRSGSLKSEPCDAVLVVQRRQEPLYPLDDEAACTVRFKAHELTTSTEQRAHQAKNARALARLGKSAVPYVPASVAAYIAEHNLYCDTRPLFCLTTNASIFERVRAIEPAAEQISIDIALQGWQQPKEAARHKLKEAMRLGRFPIVVVEEFILIDALGPHYIPLDDPTLRALSTDAIGALLEGKEGRASVLTIVAYAAKADQVQVLESVAEVMLSAERLAANDSLEGAMIREGTDSVSLLLKALKSQRIGFMTGVFNPIHRGHLQALAAAKRHGNLDRIYVVPTPGTNHNEVPIDWDLRCEMVRLAVASLEGIECIPEQAETALRAGTGLWMDQFMQQFPNAHFVHIMGSDSFERFEAHHLDRLPSDYSVLVVQRPGHSLPRSDHAKVSLIESDCLAHSEERASSTIRRYLEQGRPISHLVTPEVEAFIESRALYRVEQREAA